jgi:hypothetical protein
MLLKTRLSWMFPPDFVPIFSISVEVEISNEQPKVIIINRKIKKPVDKLISRRRSTRTINNNQVPGAKRMSRGHGKGDGKRVFLNCAGSVHLRGPTDKNLSRGTNSRTIIKTIKPFGCQIPN